MQVDLRRRGLQSFNPADFATSAEHLELLLRVGHLDLSFNALYTIRGLDGLTHLTVLNVAHNGLRSLGGGLPLTLRELDASHNSLRTLQDAALLPLSSLTTLNVSFNELEDLRGVPNVTAQLTHLDVRSNRLRALDGIEHCGQLQVLHAESNLLCEVADVAAVASLHSLSSVFLADNPLLLRKRLVRQVRHLLPESVDTDDVPASTATGGASSTSARSSTAAPSSACSLDTSVVNSYADPREQDRRSSRHATSTSLAAPSIPTPPAAVTRPATISPPPTIVPPLSVLSSSPSPSHAIVGGDGDSPPCPRRALPTEHRLSSGTSPSATATVMSTHSASQRRAAQARQMPSALPLSLAARGPSPHPTFSSAVANSDAGRRRVLSQEALEEQLVRVMAERDAYRAEAASLRTTVEQLQQQLAAARMTTVATAAEESPPPSVDLTASALSDLRTAHLRSPPSHTPSRIALSIDGSSVREAAATSTDAPPRSRLTHASPHRVDAAAAASSRVLAVEMSASSSSAHSENDAMKDANMNNKQRSGATIAAANSSPASSFSSPATAASVHVQQQQQQQQQQRVATSTALSDRRAVAALFMAKLQKPAAA